MNRLLNNVLNSVNEINILTKKVNMLLSKGMSNSYFLSGSLKFNCLGLKNLYPDQFWEAPAHADLIEF